MVNQHLVKKVVHYVFHLFFSKSRHCEDHFEGQPRNGYSVDTYFWAVLIRDIIIVVVLLANKFKIS